MTDPACQFCGAPAEVIYARNSAPGHRFEVHCDHQPTCPMIIDGWPTAPDAIDAWSGIQTAKET